MTEKRPPAWTWTVATAALMGLVAFAGCVGDNVDVEGVEVENLAPDAKLEANRERAWNDETFRFDASDSEDSDGNITQYRFDFGDGTDATVSQDEDPEVTHQYAHGGGFVVTLTVTDDGQEQTGSLTDTDTMRVAVNERQPVAAQVISGPGDGNDTAAEFEQPFEVYEGADTFEVELDVSSLLAVGSSEVSVRVIGPDDSVLDEETVSVAAGETESILLDGNLDEQGTHRVEIDAESGSAAATGELRAYYDEGWLDRDDTEAA